MVQYENFNSAFEDAVGATELERFCEGWEEEATRLDAAEPDEERMAAMDRACPPARPKGRVILE